MAIRIFLCRGLTSGGSSRAELGDNAARKPDNGVCVLFDGVLFAVEVLAKTDELALGSESNSPLHSRKKESRCDKLRRSDVGLTLTSRA